MTVSIAPRESSRICLFFTMFLYSRPRLVQRHCPFWIAKYKIIYYFYKVVCVPSIYFIHHCPVASNQSFVSRYTRVTRDPGGWILSLFSFLRTKILNRANLFRSGPEIEIISVQIDFRCRRREKNRTVADKRRVAFACPWHWNLYFLDETIDLDLRLKERACSPFPRDVTCSNPPGYLNAHDR